MRFWLGAYTADMDGRASGIGTLLAGASDDGSAGGPMAFAGDAASADSPSWLAQHPSLDVIYAALEGEQTVAAFARTGESTLAPLGAPVEAGAAVCHVAVAPDGRSLIASCWGDGRVVRIGLDAAGRPSAPSLGAAAVDPFAGPVDPCAAVALDPSAERDTEVEAELAAASRSLRAALGDEFAAYVPGYDEVEDSAQELGGGVLLGAGQVVEDGPPQRVLAARTPRSSSTTAGSRRPTSASTWCGSGAPAPTDCDRTTMWCCPRGRGRGTWFCIRVATCMW